MGTPDYASDIIEIGWEPHLKSVPEIDSKDIAYIEQIAGRVIPAEVRWLLRLHPGKVTQSKVH